MVEKFTGFKASDGKPFDTERDAHIHELFLLLKPIADNDPIARRLTDELSSSPHEVHQVLQRIVALSPMPAVYEPVPVPTVGEQMERWGTKASMPTVENMHFRDTGE